MMQILLQKRAPADWGWCWWAHWSLCQGTWDPPRKSSSLLHLRDKALPWRGPQCWGPEDSPSQRCCTISLLKREHVNKVSILRCFKITHTHTHSVFTIRLDYTHVTSSVVGLFTPLIFTHTGYSKCQRIWAWRPWHSLRRSERCAWWACSRPAAWLGLWSAAPWRTCPSDLHTDNQSRFKFFTCVSQFKVLKQMWNAYVMWLSDIYFKCSFLKLNSAVSVCGNVLGYYGDT